MTEYLSSGGRIAERVAAELSGQIKAGQHPTGEFLPSVRELVSKHAAAKVTVNKALRLLERQGLVVSQPRKGYRVCLGATDPDCGLPIAYVNSTRHEVGQGRDTFHETLLLEFQRVAGSRGWSLLTVDADRLKPGEILNQVASANACGAIVNTAQAALWEELRRAGLPIVLVDAWHEGLSADCVLQDGFLGGLQAAGHLVENAHQEIAWFGPGPRDQNPQILERYSGAAVGLARAGRSFACEVHAPLGRPEEALEQARALLKGRGRPSGILALWRGMAEAIARASAELGLALGKDFEMVGWCTEEEYERSYTERFPRGRIPPTVVWSIARMAEAAVARLKQKRVEPCLGPAFIRIPTRLIHRRRK